MRATRPERVNEFILFCLSVLGEKDGDVLRIDGRRVSELTEAPKIIKKTFQVSSLMVRKKIRLRKLKV